MLDSFSPWPDSLRPKLNSIDRLAGHARRCWDGHLKQWRQGHKSHLVFWGPPGCGKTTLANLLCEVHREFGFRHLSAVRDGTAEIKKAMDALPMGATLFIDEIHRLTRPQQDLLLPTLEAGHCWLLAATTENPATVLSPAFLSRVRTLRIYPPTAEELENVLQLAFSERASQNTGALTQDKVSRIESQWIPVLCQRSEGDVRLALNILDGLIDCEGEAAEQDLLSGQLRAWTSKTHFDYASAMIKSMRGSDPDAALFYAFGALKRGEDPMFLLRRCVIFASEDVGNADPTALRIALDCVAAFETIGMPEGRYALAQCICYLSSTVKSNRVLKAIECVERWWNEGTQFPQKLAPPDHLVQKGHEKYKYPHNYPQSFVREQYLPSEIEKYRSASGPAYVPSSEGIEARLMERLKSLWK